ncbi:hypothetical protein MIND_00233500 [Mycena indigotica]|uniref:Oxidase ustYa n=1 Tax=Mycena indigotica TaxID=2126181 RepID=A0A8H6T8K3_9AGAR|nr:uncharacterized protein MIND_00233500 [Mycena indigotica]KAF7312206.1 hypothetical protein MIND_00233500 [Mycena indigotica]
MARSITHEKILGATLVALSLTSMWFTYTLFNYVQVTLSLVPSNSRPSPSARAYRPQKDEHSYSYIGDDFPPLLPGVALDERIKMVAEESVQYSLLPEARDAWYAAFPDGVGSVRLGLHHRTFFVSMYHELHCLQQFRDTLVDLSPHVAWGHLHHCLNYLRERALCQADLTLEPGDFTTRNFEHDRTGATHVCRDWSAVISKVDDNWSDWVAIWKEFHNVTALPS